MQISLIIIVYYKYSSPEKWKVSRFCFYFLNRYCHGPANTIVRCMQRNRYTANWCYGTQWAWDCRITVPTNQYCGRIIQSYLIIYLFVRVRNFFSNFNHVSTILFTSHLYIWRQPSLLDKIYARLLYIHYGWDKHWNVLKVHCWSWWNSILANSTG